MTQPRYRTEVADEPYDHDAHVWEDEGGRGPNRLLRVLLALLVVGLLLAGAAAVWVQRQIDPPGSPGDAVEVVIPTGSSTARIAAILDERGVITNATLFRYWVRIKGADPFEAGTYQFRTNQSFNDVLDVLGQGGQLAFQRLTVPEGRTLEQVAELVGGLPGRSAERFLELARSGQVRSKYQPAGSTNLEGLLFPDTYNVTEKDDELAILRRMVTTFEEQAAAAGIDSVPGMDPYRAIIVASLVESEGRVAEDRPKIARVIYNRLNQDMLLQIDATVIYARGGQRRPDGRVLYRDLEVDSPYNTYKVKGLPPTPIAMPGRAAMEATASPADGPWLFYVKYQRDGTHAFATTLAEHNRNIADAKRRGVNP